MNIQRFNDLLRVNSCYKRCIAGCFTHRLADFPDKFDYKNVASEWTNVWEKHNYFQPKDKEKGVIRMMLPPPNVTGSLHLGHALDTIIQDVLARWYRMKGHPVIWIPGMDHAGIATELIVKRSISQKTGQSKLSLERENLISHIWKWKQEKEAVIKQQLKDLGATLDWQREYFTMSEEMNRAVVEAFVTLNARDLLYRKKAFVNWCPTLSSSISDLEVEYMFLEEKTKIDVPGYSKKVSFGEIAEIAFSVEDLNEEIVICTTRPETLFGDVALAVNPNDSRYVKYIGRRVWHPLREKYIPIIADPLVDKEFGTGVLKITPAHDITDFEIAKNFDLERIDVIDEYGKLTEACAQYKGLPRYIARDKILHELSQRGILKRLRNHKMGIPRCSRSGDIIENMLKEQWFVRCKGMAERAVEAVKNGTLRIDPTDQRERWCNMLSNTRDWVVSRQISWGHRIPAYKLRVNDNIEWFVARSKEEAKLLAQDKFGKISESELEQDEDVLDTWFSSGILPFSSVGWPSKDYEAHYPLTLMVTGHDILLSWVARMVMLSMELTNQLPFREVLLHGMICDASGRKMSKTIGNVISPENVINGISLEELNEQIKQTSSVAGTQKSDVKRITSLNSQMFPKGVPDCGADGLRLYLCSSPIKNTSINFDLMQCKADRNFCNKIWQASRYILRETDGTLCDHPKSFTIADRWILSRLALMVETVNSSLAEREFRKAAVAIKNFFYYEFCDYYLEATKWGFRSAEKSTAKSHKYTLVKCLEVSLRICAPILPFITDDLYKRLSTNIPEFRTLSSLLEAPYPLPEEFQPWREPSLDEQVSQLIELTFDIRSFLSNISKQAVNEIRIATDSNPDFTFYMENLSLLKAGCKIYNISILPTTELILDENSECCYHLPDCSIIFKTDDASTLQKIKKNIDCTIEKRNIVPKKMLFNTVEK